MDQVDNFITELRNIERRICEKISSSSLYGGLEDGAADERVTAPLAGVSTLGVDSNPHLLLTPWCGDQLELWPLPTDMATTGQL